MILHTLKHSARGGGAKRLIPTLTFALLAALAAPVTSAIADDDWPAPWYILKHSGNPDSLQARASTPLAEGQSHSIKIMFQARNIHISDFFRAPNTALADDTSWQTWVTVNCGGGPSDRLVWKGCYHPKPNSGHRPLIDPYIEVALGTVNSAAWTISASSYPSSTGASWDTEVPQGPVLKHYEHIVTLTIMAVDDTCKGQTPHSITVKIRGDDPIRDLESETFTIKKKDNDPIASTC